MIAGGVNVGMHWGYFHTTPGGTIIEFEEKLPGKESVVSLANAAGNKELHLDYINVIAEDLNKTSQFLFSALGIGPWRTTKQLLEKDRLERVVGEPCSIKVAFAKLPPISLELIQPVAGKSFWSQLIETRGEGISHIGFSVANWEETRKKIEENGGRMLASGIQNGRHWSYFHTTPGGIVVNLREKSEVSIKNRAK